MCVYFTHVSTLHNMLVHIYESIVHKLEAFREDLRRIGIEYYLKCVRKRRSCIVIIILRNPNTNKKVINLRLKVRNHQEMTFRFGDLLTSCRYFALGVSPSGSPEY